MFRALYTAATGMTAQQLNLDNIANNLSNASTAGFRSRRLQFQDLMYQNMVVPGSAATQQTTVATGLQVGLGARPTASEILQTQGEFQSTGNPLDIAIQGGGYFQVQLPDGSTGYTRAGQFHLDAQGNVVTSDGNPLQPSITIPSDAQSISIGVDGTVTVTQPGQTQAQQVGTIQLASFANSGGLNSVGRNLFQATTASGDPTIGTPGGAEGTGTLQQGMLEQSNVSVVDEFIQMILAQRSFQSPTNSIQGRFTGVTLTLSSAAPNTDVILNVSPDVSQAAQAVSDWVDAYNTLVGSVNAQFSYDASTETSGVLAGDSSIRMLQESLLKLASFSGDASGSGSLRSIGIEMKDDGTLAVNTSTLNDVLANHFDTLTSFFQASGSFGETLGTTALQLNSPTQGAIALDLRSMQQTGQDLKNEIDDFEARLTSQQQTLLLKYSQINATLQSLPSLQNQLSEVLNSFSNSSSRK